MNDLFEWRFRHRIFTVNCVGSDRLVPAMTEEHKKSRGRLKKLTKRAKAVQMNSESGICSLCESSRLRETCKLVSVLQKDMRRRQL